MNDAQLRGIRDVATAVKHWDTVTKTGQGYEVRRSGKLIGVTATFAGATELLRVAS